ncbi:MAG: PD-(D/E)XK nuclease family protein [Patescibacteria group bacterium]
MRISYTALDTYKSCPLKFKFQEIDKIKVPKNIELIFGSVVHSSLKYMFERSPLYPTIDQVIDFFRNLWDEKLQAFNTPDFEQKKKVYYEEGIDMLKRFYKHNQPWNFNVVDLESRFEADITDKKSGEKHTLVGTIDRIDKNHDENFYEIIDYKTQKRMPSKDSIDQDLQISIYQLGLIKKWPHLSHNNIKLSFYFLKHGEKISTSRTEEQIEKTKHTIIKNINEVKTRINNNFDFPAYPSVLCEWCGYRSMCPMWKHLYDQKYAKLDDGQAKEIVKEYFDLKSQNEQNNERLDELKAIIFGFMDDQKIDRVFGSEGYLTRKTQERFSYDLEKIKEILTPLGKWEEILSADEKKLEKILSSLSEEVQEKILALRTKKQITTLTASKKKIESEEK